MLRMLVVFFVWKVEGFCVPGLALNVAAFSLCITQCDQRHADPLDEFTVHSVTIKCLGIVVLSLATRTGHFRMGSHAVVVFLCKKKQKNRKPKKRKQTPLSIR